MSSKYFAFIDGKPHDFRFKKRQSDDGNWLFYLGEHFIAILGKKTFGVDKGSWFAIVQGDLPVTTPRLVYGFVSRHAAIDYALLIHEKTNYLSRKGL